MKRNTILLLLATCLGLALVGCNKEDDQYTTSAPPAGPNAKAEVPRTDKKMPGPMGAAGGPGANTPSAQAIK